eukprot:gene4086-biopygen4022
MRGSVSCGFWLVRRSNELPATQNRTAVISDLVSVPVLSEQMHVAPPMVSHAARCLTKFLSVSICFIEYAREIVTESGSPSGTATTTIATAVVSISQYFMNENDVASCQSRNVSRAASTKNVAAAAARPNLPMVSARPSSFSCSGVGFFAARVAIAMWPRKEVAPTATTRAEQDPSTRDVPEIKKGSCSGDLMTSSVSPVTSLSSKTTRVSVSDPSRRQSASICSPCCRCSWSPTTTSDDGIECACRPRVTVTFLTVWAKCSSSANFFCFWKSFTAVTTTTMATDTRIAAPSIQPVL